MTKHFWLSVVLALVLLVPAKAQEITFRQQLKVDNPTAISIDRKGNFFITDRRNNLYQFSPEGQQVNMYSPQVSGQPSLVEAWSIFKILLFYYDNQQILLLDRFLRPLSTIRLNENFNGLIRVATLAADDTYWLFNESEVSLVKYDPVFSEVRQQTPLAQLIDARPEITYMREYQNNLYVVDKVNGIYVFDNLGNYKKKLPFTGLDYVGFRENELYYYQDNKVFFFDLYNFKERRLELPRRKPYLNALVSDQILYMLLPDGVDIYTL